MKVAIVADAGGKIGLGHLGRCMALAQALKRFHRAHIIFMVEDAAGRAWVRDKGFITRKTFSGYWDLIIADSYRFRSSDYRIFRKAARVFCIVDDSGHVRFPCDWVLNSSVSAKKTFYAASPADNFLLGPKFHPLRKEYNKQPAPSVGLRPVRNALVVLGATVNSELLGAMVKAVRKAVPSARLRVVTGPYKTGPVAAQDDRVSVYSSPPDMRKLIEKCDIAVSGGGQTLYELAYMGIPTVAVQMAENQHGNMVGLMDAGVILSAGKVGSPSLPRRLTKTLKALAINPRERLRMSQQGRRLVDGQGARRVADALLGDKYHA